MDYEKAYKEALERAKNLHEDAIDMSENIRAKQCEIIFPELAESEDEKNIKDLIDELKCSLRAANCQNDACRGGHEKRIALLEWAIAWLEKQGEKSAEWHSEDEQNLNACLGYISDEFLRRWLKDVIHVKYDKPADKVEPKFKVSDWCIDNEDGVIFQIVKVLDNTYTYKTNEGKEYSCTHYSLENDAHLWTIKDVKDGDVLQLGRVTVIFQKYIGNGNCRCYCSVYNGEFEIPSRTGADNSYECINAIPATKEQRDLLFKKMHEAGYMWDAESKQLLSLKAEPTREIKGNEWKNSPKWTEEDDYNVQCCIAKAERDIYLGCLGRNKELIEWLKSLKQRLEE